MSTFARRLDNTLVEVSFALRSATPLSAGEVESLVRDEVMRRLREPFGAYTASPEECVEYLKGEGVIFSDTGKASQECRHRFPEGESPSEISWEAGFRFLESVPRGKWTSYQDFARAAGSKSAQSAGPAVMKEWERRVAAGEQHVQGIHRLLASDGDPKEGWLPDIESAARTEPSIDPDSLTVGAQEQDPEGLEWTGVISVTCRRPSDWDQVVSRLGLEAFCKELEDRFETAQIEKAIEKMERDIGYLKMALTRETEAIPEDFVFLVIS